LKSGLELAGGLGLACSSRALGTQGGAPGFGDDPVYANGSLLGLAAFVGESDVPLDQVFNQGLDGRLYSDLSRLDATQLITPNQDFYIRTRYPDLLKPAPRWAISVAAEGAAPTDLFLDDLQSLVASQGAHLLECSGNSRGASFGLISTAEWSGIPLSALLASTGDRGKSTAALVSGFDQHSQPSANNQSTPGASWIFDLADVERTGAFLATLMNGDALPADHGAPVRLVVPGWYGCTCIKWVNELRFVGVDEPATSQMLEFAKRTMQVGSPTLARDFQPAEIDVAAMPVRVEKWRVAGAIRYRVVGIEWGGAALPPSLEINFGSAEWLAVDRRTGVADSSTWRLWEHQFAPSTPGVYPITLRVPDRSVRTRRLDAAFYLREISIDEV
jgi:DMSO/TMAO reductase YedYZ molybdopterin-dependent catalytic subunit